MATGKPKIEVILRRSLDSAVPLRRPAPVGLLRSAPASAARFAARLLRYENSSQHWIQNRLGAIGQPPTLGSRILARYLRQDGGFGSVPLITRQRRVRPAPGQEAGQFEDNWAETDLPVIQPNYEAENSSFAQPDIFQASPLFPEPSAEFEPLDRPANPEPNIVQRVLNRAEFRPPVLREILPPAATFMAGPTELPTSEPEISRAQAESLPTPVAPLPARPMERALNRVEVEPATEEAPPDLPPSWFEPRPVWPQVPMIVREGDEGPGLVKNPPPFDAAPAEAAIFEQAQPSELAQTAQPQSPAPLPEPPVPALEPALPAVATEPDKLSPVLADSDTFTYAEPASVFGNRPDFTSIAAEAARSTLNPLARAIARAYAEDTSGESLTSPTLIFRKYSFPFQPLETASGPTAQVITTPTSRDLPGSNRAETISSPTTASSVSAQPALAGNEVATTTPAPLARINSANWAEQLPALRYNPGLPGLLPLQMAESSYGEGWQSGPFNEIRRIFVERLPLEPAQPGATPANAAFAATDSMVAPNRPDPFTPAGSPAASALATPFETATGLTALELNTPRRIEAALAAPVPMVNRLIPQTLLPPAGNESALVVAETGGFNPNASGAIWPGASDSSSAPTRPGATQPSPLMRAQSRVPADSQDTPGNESPFVPANGFLPTRDLPMITAAPPLSERRAGEYRPAEAAASVNMPAFGGFELEPAFAAADNSGGSVAADAALARSTPPNQEGASAISWAAEPAFSALNLIHPSTWIQRKALDGGSAPVSPIGLQTSLAQPGARPATTPAIANLQLNLLPPPGAGRPLERTVQERMGQIFRVNLEHVRVYTDDHAVEATRQMGAEAFTTGSNIFFGAGRYQPETASGQALIGHELTHVVQQAHLPSLGNGRIPETSSEGQTLEREALHNEQVILRHLESNSLKTQYNGDMGVSDTNFRSSSGTIERSPNYTPVATSHLQPERTSSPNLSSIVERELSSLAPLPSTTVSRVLTEPAESEADAQKKKEEVEKIAQEVLRLLKQELVIERERSGMRNSFY